MIINQRSRFIICVQLRKKDLFLKQYRFQGLKRAGFNSVQEEKYT